MKLDKKVLSGVLIAVGVVAVVPFVAYAAQEAESQLTQEITAGALSTDIRNASGVVVASPVFPMTGVVASTTQQTATGTFGSNTQRVTVDNPGGANGGWTLTWNATTPGAAQWVSGSDTYDYNGTVADGQLTVDPSVGQITPLIGGATGVSLGGSASFSGTNPISLLTADATSADVWNGYITGVGLSQTIPAGQPVGSYTIDMTQTIAAV